MCITWGTTCIKVRLLNLKSTFKMTTPSHNTYPGMGMIMPWSLLTWALDHLWRSSELATEVSILQHPRLLFVGLCESCDVPEKVENQGTCLQSIWYAAAHIKDSHEHNMRYMLWTQMWLNAFGYFNLFVWRYLVVWCLLNVMFSRDIILCMDIFQYQGGYCVEK
jgi:hypothetical protein